VAVSKRFKTVFKQNGLKTLKNIHENGHANAQERWTLGSVHGHIHVSKLLIGMISGGSRIFFRGANLIKKTKRASVKKFRGAVAPPATPLDPPLGMIDLGLFCVHFRSKVINSLFSKQWTQK
jgi:hypothetical protein